MCHAGRNHLSLQEISRLSRNLLEQPLDQIWRKSEVLEQVRNKENLKGKCGPCEVEDCRGCRSLAFALTGDYLEEDPHCSHFPSCDSAKPLLQLNPILSPGSTVS